MFTTIFFEKSKGGTNTMRNKYNIITGFLYVSRSNDLHIITMIEPCLKLFKNCIAQSFFSKKRHHNIIMKS